MKINKVTKLRSGLYEVEFRDGRRAQYRQLPEDLEIVDTENNEITSTDNGRDKDNV